MNNAGYRDTGVFQNTSLNPALLHELFIRLKTSPEKSMDQNATTAIRVTFKRGLIKRIT